MFELLGHFKHTQKNVNDLENTRRSIQTAKTKGAVQNYRQYKDDTGTTHHDTSYYLDINGNRSTLLVATVGAMASRRIIIGSTQWAETNLDRKVRGINLIAHVVKKKPMCP